MAETKLRRWDEGEDDVLRVLWPAHGPSWVGWDEGAIPGRTAKAARQRAQRLGLTYSSPRWGSREVEAVRKYYPLHGPDWDGWDELIPDRTRHAIQMCASRIGVKAGPDAPSAKGLPWSDAELEALARLYPEHGGAWDGWRKAIPGRSRNAIVSMAKAVGIHKARPAEKAAAMAPEIVAEAGRLYALGASTGEVVRRTASMIGVSAKSMESVLPAILRGELRRRQAREHGRNKCST